MWHINIYVSVSGVWQLWDAYKKKQKPENRLKIEKSCQRVALRKPSWILPWAKEMDGKLRMLPRHFELNEATRQTTNFTTQCTWQSIQRDEENKNKNKLKKTITRLIYFHLAEQSLAFDYWITELGKWPNGLGRGRSWGSCCALGSRPVLPFFTFNEAQEFLLDNLLSAGQPKGKKPKGASAEKLRTEQPAHCNKDTNWGREGLGAEI